MVEALEEVDVAAELSGTVVAVYVNEGDRVQAGQLLLELTAEKMQLGLRRARQAKKIITGIAKLQKRFARS